MLDLCDNIEGKSFCPLGDAAAWPIQSRFNAVPKIQEASGSCKGVPRSAHEDNIMTEEEY